MAYGLYPLQVWPTSTRQAGSKPCSARLLHRRSDVGRLWGRQYSGRAGCTQLMSRPQAPLCPIQPQLLLLTGAMRRVAGWMPLLPQLFLIAWNLVGLGSLGVGPPMVASCLGKCGGCPLACAGQCPAGLVRFRTLRFGRWRSHRRETHKRGRSRKAGLSPRTCEAMMLPPGSPVSSLRLGLASQRHLAFHATHACQARPSPVGAVRQMHTRDGGGGVEVPIFSAHPCALGDWLGLGRGAGLAVWCPATGLHCRHVGA